MEHKILKAEDHLDKCCIEHGCHYKDPFCPIVSGRLEPTWSCTKCEAEANATQRSNAFSTPEFTIPTCKDLQETIERSILAKQHEELKQTGRKIELELQRIANNPGFLREFAIITGLHQHIIDYFKPILKSLGYTISISDSLHDGHKSYDLRIMW